MKINTLFLFIVLLFNTSLVVAEASKTVIGIKSYASNCYRNSQQAVITGFASTKDIDACNEALFAGGLKKKEIVATHVNRGVLSAAINDLPNAAKDYRRALELDSEAGEAYLNRGNLWFVSGDLKEAIDDYNRAIEYGVSKPHVAHLNRGMANENLGVFANAEKDYRAAIEYAPEWVTAIERLDRLAKKQAKKLDRDN